MAEIVNLNRARKVREKSEARRKAEANRVAFGRPKHEREAATTERLREAARLDGHRLREDEASS